MSSPAPGSDLEHAKAEPSPPRLCLNCQAALNGPYCAHCGQHDVDYHRSFYHLTHDLLENLFHFDGKFLVSVAWLLAKPGRLTNEFNAGRRHSQVNPLRFYIFATVLFFLGVHLLNHGHLFDFDRRAADLTGNIQFGRGGSFNATTGLTPEQRDELGRVIAESAVSMGGKLDQKQIDDITRQIRDRSARATKTIDAAGTDKAGAPPTPVKNGLGVKLDESSGIGRALNDKFASGELTFSKIVDEIEGKVPTLLFLGMPVFALLLKLLYFGSGRYYIEHLIFSLHLHTWVFLVWMVSTGYLELAALGPSFLTTILVLALIAWIGWYMLTAFRTVYGQPWKRTAVKLVILGFAYSAALTCMAVALVAGIVVWLAVS